MSAKDNHPVDLSIPRRTFLRRTAMLAGAAAAMSIAPRHLFGAGTPLINNPAPNINIGPFQLPTSLWVWGADTEGELGNHANVDRLQPVPNNVFFPAGTVLTSLAAGNGNIQNLDGTHSLAVDMNRNLWAWGFNGFGQVGYP